jgi:hypothetical protein
MKYCRACKIRASDNDTVCARCGEPLATFGARPVTEGDDVAEPAGPALALEGKIRKLRRAHRKNVRRRRWLTLVCTLVLLAVLATLYVVYDAAVLSFAVLDHVIIEQDSVNPQKITVSFQVVQPGKVAYDRRSGRNRTEKLDVIATRGPGGIAWDWRSDAQTGIDFQVVYRNGLIRETVSRHFSLTPTVPRSLQEGTRP